MSRRDHKKAEDSRIVLPITPMLDMTFQLLFFFIVSFNPADLEGAVDVHLPAGRMKPGEPRIAVPPPAPAEEPAFPTEWTVKVRAAVDGGGISSVGLRNPEGREAMLAGLGSLKARLRALRDGLANKEGIKLQGDGKLRTSALVEAMDACRAAGFTDIRLVPPDGQ